MHAGDATLGHLAAAIEGHPIVEGHLAAHAEGLGVLGEDVHEFGVTQQRLGWDAADVEAHAAPILRFDDCGVQAQLRGADGCDIAAGTGSEDNNVIVRSHEPTLVGGDFSLHDTVARLGPGYPGRSVNTG
ncbi:hypothetical protein MSIM_17900 [Mycobacterium simiae]|nr:hypothetical protein MSIM_17900 [Mycobacterium simiae]